MYFRPEHIFSVRIASKQVWKCRFSTLEMLCEHLRQSDQKPMLDCWFPNGDSVYKPCVILFKIVISCRVSVTPYLQYLGSLLPDLLAHLCLQSGSTPPVFLFLEFSSPCSSITMSQTSLTLPFNLWYTLQFSNWFTYLPSGKPCPHPGRGTTLLLQTWKSTNTH